jgi:hypothetical protein
MDRFILQESEKPNHWVCTDQINRIVCVFECHKYNNTQKFTLLEDFNENNYMELARFAREMGEWLRLNHYDKVF